MSDKSSIEWTDATWNPTVGCSRVSEGCRHCYAERMAWRHVLMCQSLGRKCKYEGTVHLVNGEPRWTGVVRLDPDSLTTPLHWKRPRKIFVDSMSDLFHEGLTFLEIAAMFGVMAACGDRAIEHTFQVLTKRPERAAEFFGWLTMSRLRAQTILHQAVKAALGYDHPERPAVNVLRGWPLPNVILCTSIEDQPTADERIPHLLNATAARRGLSIEPLLGDVYLKLDYGVADQPGVTRMDLIDWVIVGGESGPGARPMHPDWVRSIRDQCIAAGVPFFFKQWGEWIPSGEVMLSTGSESADGRFFATVHRETFWRDTPHPRKMLRAGKKKAGRLLDGREWNEMPAPSDRQIGATS